LLGGCFRSVENGFEENCVCVIESLRSDIITHYGGLRIELFEGVLAELAPTLRGL